MARTAPCEASQASASSTGWPEEEERRKEVCNRSQPLNVLFTNDFILICFDPTSSKGLRKDVTWSKTK